MSRYFDYRCTSIQFLLTLNPPIMKNEKTVTDSAIDMNDLRERPLACFRSDTEDSAENAEQGSFSHPGHMIRACNFPCVLRYPAAPLYAPEELFERSNELLRSSKRIFALLGPRLLASSGMETRGPTFKTWRDVDVKIFLAKWYL
jgi:hypothetical protein